MDRIFFPSTPMAVPNNIDIYAKRATTQATTSKEAGPLEESVLLSISSQGVAKLEDWQQNEKKNIDYNSNLEKKLEDTYEGMYESKHLSYVDDPYGYAEAWDSVSGDYAEQILGSDKGTHTHVIFDMEDKYSGLKERIETQYMGEEKEKRMSALESSYQTFLEANVLAPTRQKVSLESVGNRLRQKMINLNERAMAQRHYATANTPLGEMVKNSKEISKDIQKETEVCRRIQGQMKVMLNFAHNNNGAGMGIANNMLQDVNTYLCCIDKQKADANVYGTLSKDYKAEMGQMSELLAGKGEIYDKALSEMPSYQEGFQTFADMMQILDDTNKGIQNILNK